MPGKALDLSGASLLLGLSFCLGSLCLPGMRSAECNCVVRVGSRPGVSMTCQFGPFQDLCAC